MIPRHHPPEDGWLDYATGQAEGVARRLLDVHLAFCDPCREIAAQAAQPGGALLRQGVSEAAPPGLLEGILGRLKPVEAPKVGTEILPLPRRIWPLLPDLAGARWRGALASGFRYLEPSPGLFLVCLGRGCRFPEHDHHGTERSVILAGGLVDGDLRLEAGDYDEAEPGRVHHPMALPDEDCWLLAGSEGRIRFTGWRGWAQRAIGKR